MVRDKILAVLMNWRRPNNIKPIIESYRMQSAHIDRIALVDCAIEEQYQVPENVRKLADICFTVDSNLGPCCRFIPPALMTEYKYTFFGVDDHVPGRRHVEYLRTCADALGDAVATIGCDGRIFRDGQILRRNAASLRKRSNLPSDQAMPVDVITSSELMPTRHLPHALAFRERLIRDCGSGISAFEDDLFLCLGITHALPWTRCFVVPSSDDPETCWRSVRLPAPHALSARVDHDKWRNDFIRKAMVHGWVPTSEWLLQSGVDHGGSSRQP